MKKRVLAIGQGYVKEVDYTSPRSIAEYIDPDLKESEDERIRKGIIYGMNALKEQHKETFASIPINDCIAWLKSIKDRVQPQPTPEWSEYDKIQLSEAIQMIEANGTWIRSEDAVKKVSNWLKSLKDKAQPQPTSEWSKEDEEMYNEVLTDIIYTKNDMKTKGCLELSNRAMKAFNWFSKRYKSLRPQSKWKPSEE